MFTNPVIKSLGIITASGGYAGDVNILGGLKKKLGVKMEVHNMLEKNGNGYVNGNIKLIKIKPAEVTVYLRGGAMLVYKNIEKLNSNPRVEGENAVDFDLVASE